MCFDEMRNNSFWLRVLLIHKFKNPNISDIVFVVEIIFLS